MKLRSLPLILGVLGTGLPATAAVSVGDKAPAVEATEWMNTRPLDWRKLRGRLILIEFWATW